MSQPNKKHSIITAVEYFMMQDKNQPYQGYVVYPDGEVTFALSEVVIESSFSDSNFNKFTQYAFNTGVKYHESPTPYICETDNIHVDRESLVLKTKASNENYFTRGFEGHGGWNYCYGAGSFLFGVADGISLGMLTGVGATKSIGLLKTAPILYSQRSFYLQKFLSRESFHLHPRITTKGWPGIGQLDVGHRATTFFSTEIIQSGIFGIKNINTIYFNKVIGDKTFSVGINPWKRTIFHEAVGKFK